MKKQTDLRIIRTRQMIKEAFFELMASDGFSNITIEKLTKKAFISRNTFYLHYADKFDLMNQIENEVLDGLKDISKDVPIEVIKVKGLNDEQPISVLRHIYEYIKENGNFFKLMMSTDGDPAFLSKFSDTIKNVFISRNLDSQFKIQQRYIFAVMIGAITGLIGEWVNSGMKESPDELVDIIVLILGEAPKKLYIQ